MKVLVHDYAGHPFQIQLSRNLTRRGHEVMHVYSRSIQTPQARLESTPDDDGLEVVGITLSRPLKKYSFLTRRRQDIEHGRRAAGEIARFGPEVVLSGNTWLDAQTVLLRHCRASGVRFAYWVQDFFGIGIHRVLSRRIPVLGSVVGKYYMAREGQLLRASDAVVLIADNFRDVLKRYDVPAERVHVIENWAPLDDVPMLPKDNAWAREHGLADRFCFLYSGTMGMKHNPQLMAALAESFREAPEVRVVVVSEGLGAEWLRRRKAEAGLDNLEILGFQPFERLPEVLASADVLLAVLEPEASAFSVPSKVLTYLCAKRPLLLAVPPDNLAARITREHRAGATVDPHDMDGFVRAARELFGDAALRTECAASGRRYAERRFEIDDITDRFEEVLSA